MGPGSGCNRFKEGIPTGLGFRVFNNLQIQGRHKACLGGNGKGWSVSLAQRDDIAFTGGAGMSGNTFCT